MLFFLNIKKTFLASFLEKAPFAIFELTKINWVTNSNNYEKDGHPPPQKKKNIYNHAGYLLDIGLFLLGCHSRVHDNFTFLRNWYFSLSVHQAAGWTWFSKPV